jgi:hypothetical protein
MVNSQPKSRRFGGCCTIVLDHRRPYGVIAISSILGNPLAAPELRADQLSSQQESSISAPHSNRGPHFLHRFLPTAAALRQQPSPGAPELSPISSSSPALSPQWPPMLEASPVGRLPPRRVPCQARHIQTHPHRAARQRRESIARARSGAIDDSRLQRHPMSWTRAI